MKITWLVIKQSNSSIASHRFSQDVEGKSQVRHLVIKMFKGSLALNRNLAMVLITIRSSCIWRLRFG